MLECVLAKLWVCCCWLSDEKYSVVFFSLPFTMVRAFQNIKQHKKQHTNPELHTKKMCTYITCRLYALVSLCLFLSQSFAIVCLYDDMRVSTVFFLYIAVFLHPKEKLMVFYFFHSHYFFSTDFIYFVYFFPLTLHSIASSYSFFALPFFSFILISIARVI